MPFAPVKNGQMDGSRYQNQNCVPATVVMLIDRSTNSAKRPKTTTVRSRSGVTTLRGITYGEAAVVAATFGVKLEPRYGLSRDAVKSLVAGGRPIGISIHTSVTSGTSRRTGSFIGGHTVYANAYYWVDNGICRCERKTTVDHGEYDVEDPGTTSAGYLRWSASLLYRAAEKRTGGNGINVLVGRDTEGVTRKVVMTANVRASSSVTAAKKGSIPVGTTGVKVTRTVTGGPWKRANGTTGNCWCVVDDAPKVGGGTVDGLVKGEALQ